MSQELNPKTGLWDARFRIRGDGGKMHQKRLSGFKTQKKAERAEKAFLEEYNMVHPKGEQGDDLYFDFVRNEYLKHIEMTNKKSSFHTIRSKINNHITPFFSGKRFRDISLLDIHKWQQSVAHLSYNHRCDLQTQLKGIYIYGEKYYDIKNVMKKADPMKNNSEVVAKGTEKLQCWTKEEFNEFIKHVEDPEYKLFFRFLFTMGTRVGEAFALTWDCVDLQNATVFIKKNITRKAGEPFTVTTPKNRSSVRKLPLPNNLVKDFIEFKETKNPSVKDTDFVFGSDKPLSENTTYRRFKAAIKESGVTPIRIHDLRHSAASNLISSGITPKAVSQFLGHNDVKITLNTYAHLMPTDFDNLSSALETLSE